MTHLMKSISESTGDMYVCLHLRVCAWRRHKHGCVCVDANMLFIRCHLHGDTNHFKKDLIRTESSQPQGDNGNLGNGWLSNICYNPATVAKSAEEDSDQLFVSF